MTTLRPVRLPDDIESLWEIAVACESQIHDETVSTREEIRSQLEGPEADPEGIRVAVDADGTPVGFASMEVDPVGREVVVDVYARPGAGSGVLDALFEHLLAHARRVAKGKEGWTAIAGVFPSDGAYVATLTHFGFRPERRFHRMRATLDSPVDVPALAPGTRIDVVGDDEVTQQVVHAVMEEAFVDHWRHTAYPWDNWIAHVRNRAYDPTQWWLATVDGRPAGALVGNESVVDLGAAYISMLGVLKPYRGKGLGRALLLTAFKEAKRRGLTSIRLGVDTENGTGAPALYASVGMTPAEVVDAYELPLT